MKTHLIKAARFAGEFTAVYIMTIIIMPFTALALGAGLLDYWFGEC